MEADRGRSVGRGRQRQGFAWEASKRKIGTSGRLREAEEASRVCDWERTDSRDVRVVVGSGTTGASALGFGSKRAREFECLGFSEFLRANQRDEQAGSLYMSGCEIVEKLPISAGCPREQFRADSKVKASHTPSLEMISRPPAFDSCKNIIQSEMNMSISNIKRMVGGVMMSPIKIPWFHRPGPLWSLVYLVRGAKPPDSEGSDHNSLPVMPFSVETHGVVSFGDKITESLIKSFNLARLMSQLRPSSGDIAMGILFTPRCPYPSCHYQDLQNYQLEDLIVLNDQSLQLRQDSRIQRESPTDATVTAHPSIITNVTVVPDGSAGKRCRLGQHRLPPSTTSPKPYPFLSSDGQIDQSQKPSDLDCLVVKLGAEVILYAKRKSRGILQQPR
ncbi:hypothetical protein M5K25_018347 [Dendrobium thyrsiflorum]|uniref:Uncharacterized protein n=1 Tax=Dendrobium thyrsiflorum TaxID=117978 RepID=A0ABD0UPU2_DENTH